jgi:hypothetical protein
MSGSARIPFILGIAAALLWGALFLAVWKLGGFPNETIQNKFFEFDFAAYCFGLVAIAVSCAGVYISLVIDRSSDQLMRLVELHLMPDPFADRKTLEELCKPRSYSTNVERTDKVKVIYAISQLPRWKTMEPQEQAELTGPNGLDAERLGNGKRFRRFQEQLDRKWVLHGAIIISTLYATVPFLYYFAPGRVVVTELFTTYICCIAEIVLCAILFWRRSHFFSHYESRMSSWKADLKNFIVMTVSPAAPPPDPSTPPPPVSGPLMQWRPPGA